jgi:hypothetical protein
MFYFHTRKQTREGDRERGRGSEIAREKEGGSRTKEREGGEGNREEGGEVWGG